MSNLNIYQAARLSTDMTQEQAAEMIGIPTRSLRAYETSERVPPNYIVKSMCIAYGAPSLAYFHMMAADDIAADLLPSIDTKNLEQTVIEVYLQFHSFSQDKDLDRLMEIARDGKITPAEKPDFDRIVERVGDLIAAGLRLKLYHKEDQHDPT